MDDKDIDELCVRFDAFVFSEGSSSSVHSPVTADSESPHDTPCPPEVITTGPFIHTDDGCVVLAIQAEPIRDFMETFFSSVSSQFNIRPKRADHVSLARGRDSLTTIKIAKLYQNACDLHLDSKDWDICLLEYADDRARVSRVDERHETAPKLTLIQRTRVPAMECCYEHRKSLKGC